MVKVERTNRLGLALSIGLVVLLALPALRLMKLRAPDGVLYGYADQIPPRPEWRWKSFEDKTLQRWVEKYADISMGFRMVLIRSFNEINFRLFGEAPRLQLYSTTEHGLYSKMSLDALHEQTARKEALDLAYRAEAAKLMRVQELLASQGKVFLVVIAASKPYVYPTGLGRRYFRGEAIDPLAGGANYAEVLKAQGVRVVDGDRFLRRFVADTGIETHAASGVHWNYYAGCLIAGQILDLARQPSSPAAPSLDCGAPTPAAPSMIDLDGWSLLNLWTSAGLKKETNYPSIVRDSQQRSGGPRFLFVSDSFVDQITYSLKASGAYSRLVTSNYFRLRQVDDETRQDAAPAGPTDEPSIRRALLNDVADSDVVVLELVDYNTWRLSYGFADYVLENAPILARVDQGPAIGAYDREVDGKDHWNWIRERVRFDLSPVFVGPDRTATRLRFEYVTRGRQKLSGLVRTRDGQERTFVVDSRGDHLDAFDTTVDLPAGLLATITLSSDGKPSPLSANDARSAAWMLRNLTIEPASTIGAR